MFPTVWKLLSSTKIWTSHSKINSYDFKTEGVFYFKKRTPPRFGVNAQKTVLSREEKNFVIVFLCFVQEIYEMDQTDGAYTTRKLTDINTDPFAVMNCAVCKTSEKPLVYTIATGEDDMCHLYSMYKRVLLHKEQTGQTSSSSKYSYFCSLCLSMLCIL